MTKGIDIRRKRLLGVAIVSAVCVGCGDRAEAVAIAYLLVPRGHQISGESGYLPSIPAHFVPPPTPPIPPIIPPTPPITPPTPTPTPAPTPAPNLGPTSLPVYFVMPEFANQLGFAMIDTYDTRRGGGREAFAPPGPMPGVNCETLGLPTRKDAQPLPTHKGCMTPAQRAAADAQMREEAVRRYLMWGRVLGGTGEQQTGGGAVVSLATPFLDAQGGQYHASYGGIQAGVDLWRRTGPDGSHDDAGLYVGHLYAKADVDQVYWAAGAGRVSMNADSLGAYWTHFGPQGWYLDGVLQGTWFSDVKGVTNLAGMTVSGWAITASLEGGYPFRLAPSWILEPQAQLIDQYTDMGSGADFFGSTSFGGADDLRGRIGAKLSYVVPGGPGGAIGNGFPLTLWGRVNLWRDFAGSAPAATFASLSWPSPGTLEGRFGGTWGEVDAGVDAALTKSVRVYGSAFYDHSIDGDRGWSAGGRIGLGVQF